MKPCLEIRKLCLDRECSMADLGQEMGRSQSYVSNIVCAKIPADAADLLAMAKILKVPPEQFFKVFFPPEIQQMLEKKIKERGSR